MRALYPFAAEFLAGEREHLDFDPTGLSADDRRALDDVLQESQWWPPPHAAEEEAAQEWTARNRRAGDRLLTSLLLIEDSVRAVNRAARIIETACSEPPPPSLHALAADVVNSRTRTGIAAGLFTEGLVEELHHRVRVLHQRLQPRSWGDREALLAPTKSDGAGVLRLDRTFAGLLEQIGPAGKRHAAKLLGEAQERWGEYTGCTNPIDRLQAEQALWRIWQPSTSANLIGTGDTSLRVIRGLAAVLLEDVVLPRLREQKRALPPALALSVTRDLAVTYWAASRKVRPKVQGAELVGPEGVLADVPALALEEATVLERGVAALGHVTGHRLIRWLVREGHSRKILGRPEPSIIRVEGGLTKLAELVGAASKSASEELHHVLRAGQLLRKTWPGGEAGGLWTYVADDRTGPGRRAVVEIRLGAMLMPYYAKARLRKDEQLLVPLVPLPAFVSRPRDHAAQAAYQVEVLMALVERRRELVERGGADLPESLQRALAARTGLPEPTRRRVMGRWIEDGPDGPAFLERVGVNVFNLASNEVFGPARAFLLETGRRSIKQGKRARRGQRSRTRPR